MATPKLYSTLLQHFHDIAKSPLTTALDRTVINGFVEEVSDATDKVVLTAIVSEVAQLLLVLQDDPAPLAHLVMAITPFISFRDIRAIKPPVDIVGGLKVDNDTVNNMTLRILGRAGSSYEEADMAAEDGSELISALVHLVFLSTTLRVRDDAMQVMASMLTVNRKEGQEPRLGKLWKKIFDDREIYDAIFSICGSRRQVPGDRGVLSSQQYSISQARLFDFILQVAHLDWECVSQSHFPEIERLDNATSLLDFAVKQKIGKSDVVMQITYIHFLRDLIAVGAPRLSGRLSSPSLNYLIESGLHQKNIHIYTGESQDTSADESFSKNAFTAYVAQYIGLYPKHFMSLSSPEVGKILSQVYQRIDVPRSRWANGPNIREELDLVTAIPRVLLLERPMILSAIPCDPMTPLALDTLAKVFAGPSPADLDRPTNSAPQSYTIEWIREAAAARVLYIKYLLEHPDLWDRITKALETLVLSETALAACNFVLSLLHSHWEIPSAVSTPESGKVEKYVSSDKELREQLGLDETEELPKSGLWAILHPSALRRFIPHMLNSPYSAKRGDFRGTTRHELVMRKFDILKEIERQLKENDAARDGAMKDVLRAFEERVRKGPLGNQREETHPQIATMSKRKHMLLYKYHLPPANEGGSKGPLCAATAADKANEQSFGLRALQTRFDSNVNNTALQSR
ncbi:hypothetical protein KEM54_000803 [Ascosphaera aggregata]|nr:hypothetical protein KEM54_000803 [Ascosphaera aggregata]